MTPRKLPDVELEMTGGKRFRCRRQKGPYILYCYPKDMTSGCTLEGQEFSKLRGQFTDAGYEVYGASPDSISSHDKFIEKCSLSIPLISDPEHLLLEPLGVWVEKSMYGRKYMGVERSTFLVAADASIEKEWRSVRASGHAAAVLHEIVNKHS